ncbi:MAG TPA: PadR family transcriptional regulator [Longimicrobiales bacterium]|nr:PadR family transcriptional regulator [Longimicrobiales bacterium]
MTARKTSDRYLPLKPATFHILLALADGPRHGYAIRAAVEELTAGGVRLWPVTLYGSIRELSDAGLIETAARSAATDARRRYYELTVLGRRVLAAETARLRSLVEHAERTRAMRRA